MSGIISLQSVTEKLKNLRSRGMKVGSMPKIGNARIDFVWSIDSQLKMAEIIGRCIGLENITYEPNEGNNAADIYFEDQNGYYLELKTLELWNSRIGNKLDSQMREFQRILEASKNRFAFGNIGGRGNTFFDYIDVKGAKRKASIGILTISEDFVSQMDLRRAILSRLKKSASQLNRIETKDKKITVLDVTNYPLISLSRFYKTTMAIYNNNKRLFASLDGIAFLSYGPAVYQKTLNQETLNLRLYLWPFSDIDSRVFEYGIPSFRQKMFAIPNHMKLKKGLNNLMSIDKDGMLRIDDAPYGPFYQTLNFLNNL